MSDILNIRKMQEFDIEEVVKWETKLFSHSLGYDYLLKEIKENPIANYFVLELNNEFIGYMGTWSSVPNGQIVNFFILPKYQKKGYGSHFLDYIFEFFMTQLINVITLEVRVSNKIAQKVYRKKGFISSFIRENYYPNGEDAILMIKYL